MPRILTREERTMLVEERDSLRRRLDRLTSFLTCASEASVITRAIIRESRHILARELAVVEGRLAMDDAERTTLPGPVGAFLSAYPECQCGEFGGSPKECPVHGYEGTNPDRTARGRALTEDTPQ